MKPGPQAKSVIRRKITVSILVRTKKRLERLAIKQKQSQGAVIDGLLATTK